jgi:RNA polymerase sigma-70 factor (ECF subfamily)
MNSPDELKELVSKAKYGDPAAFTHLYDFYLTPIFRFIYFRVKSKEDAEDLAQHVFVKAWSALPKYEHEGKSFSAWLYRIARNTTIDYWRKKKSVPMEPDSSIFTNKPDMGDNPQEAAQRKEESEKIRNSLHLLNEDQQTILALKYIEELSNAEIAEITGKSEGAIRQVQSRGLKVLRLHFKEHNML